MVVLKAIIGSIDEKWSHAFLVVVVFLLVTGLSTLVVTRGKDLIDLFRIRYWIQFKYAVKEILRATFFPIIVVSEEFQEQQLKEYIMLSTWLLATIAYAFWVSAIPGFIIIAYAFVQSISLLLLWYKDERSRNAESNAILYDPPRSRWEAPEIDIWFSSFFRSEYRDEAVFGVFILTVFTAPLLSHINEVTQSFDVVGTKTFADWFVFIAISLASAIPVFDVSTWLSEFFGKHGLGASSQTIVGDLTVWLIKTFYEIIVLTFLGRYLLRIAQYNKTAIYYGLAKSPYIAQVIGTRAIGAIQKILDGKPNEKITFDHKRNGLIALGAIDSVQSIDLLTSFVRESTDDELRRIALFAILSHQTNNVWTRDAIKQLRLRRLKDSPLTGPMLSDCIDACEKILTARKIFRKNFENFRYANPDEFLYYKLVKVVQRKLGEKISEEAGTESFQSILENSLQPTDAAVIAALGLSLCHSGGMVSRLLARLENDNEKSEVRLAIIVTLGFFPSSHVAARLAGMTAKLEQYTWSSIAVALCRQTDVEYLPQAVGILFDQYGDQIGEKLVDDILLNFSLYPEPDLRTYLEQFGRKGAAERAFSDQICLVLETADNVEKDILLPQEEDQSSTLARMFRGGKSFDGNEVFSLKAIQSRRRNFA